LVCTYMSFLALASLADWIRFWFCPSCLILFELFFSVVTSPLFFAAIIIKYINTKQNRQNKASLGLLLAW
jgi:hypothetical protein